MSVDLIIELLRTSVQLRAPPPTFGEIMNKHKKGDLVYVKSAKFSCGKEMDKWIGRVVTLEDVRDGGETLFFKGFYWGQDDVESYEMKEPDPEIFHFDESVLDI